jgi:hypothetical protein
MLQPGDIFIYKKYTFEDGSQRDKWFVILNPSDNSSNPEYPCLVLKTTSHPERYLGCTKGCNKPLRCFFAPVTWQTCFRIDTYIQLPQIIEFTAAKLNSESLARRLEFQPSLTSDCLGQLKSCLAGFKDDISPSHWDLIYKTKNNY